MHARALSLFGEEFLPEQLPNKQAGSGLDPTADASIPQDLLTGWQPAKQYYTIGEVSRILTLPSSQIRFWTEEFAIKVRTNRKGDRLFSPEAIFTLRNIHHLLKYRGFTIPGAKAKLKLGEQATAEAISLKQTLLRLRNQLLLIRNALH